MELKSRKTGVMDAIERSSPNALAHLTQVPIAQLSPDLAQPSEKFIVAVVTLIWPYSSSNKSLSLLLAEPDARLRRPNGQVKATFHGRVAQKIAESHVGIRDIVHLSLANSKLVSNEAAKQTPGRSIAWGAHFEDAVSLEVSNSPLAPRLPELTVARKGSPILRSSVNNQRSATADGARSCPTRTSVNPRSPNSQAWIGYSAWYRLLGITGIHAVRSQLLWRSYRYLA